MFGAHQGHEVLDPSSSCTLIRSRISKSAKQGKLSSSYSNRFLLDIRDAKLKVQNKESEVKSQVESTIKKLINSLKKRKNALEDEVFNHYLQDGKIIEQAEKHWLENQEIGRQVLEFSNNPDDETVLMNSLFIFKSIERLNESPGMTEVNLVNSVDLTLQIGGKEAGLTDILREIGIFGKFGEEKNIQFRN
jgi:hypothetical protein